MTQRMVWRIVVIPGDGIGAEVVSEGQRVLDALAEDSGGAFAFEWESFRWGSEYYLEHVRTTQLACSSVSRASACNR